MMDSLEKAYEDFASIAESTFSHEVKMVVLRDLYDSLGNASVAFDNLVYERLGMSAEEAIDMIDKGDVLP